MPRKLLEKTVQLIKVPAKFELMYTKKSRKKLSRIAYIFSVKNMELGFCSATQPF